MSLESLKGTWVALGSARALMHMPSVVSDRLMLTASCARTPAELQAQCSLQPFIIGLTDTAPWAQAMHHLQRICAGKNARA